MVGGERLTEPKTLAVRCRNLSCGYHLHAVLTGVEIALSRSESVALLGMNGSGKSTLIKTIAGDLRPISGSVELVTSDGNAIDNMKLGSRESARMVSVAPQEEVNPFPFSVLEVVAMGRLAATSSIFDSEDDLEVARDAMKRTECDHLAHRPVSELSGGERQRVLIARALAQQTNVVLMDEPTAHLDPGHQLSIAKLIRSLATEGKCIVTAVHDLNLASILADRAILIGNGKIVLDDHVETVLESNSLEESYRTEFERVRTKSGRLVLIPVATSG